MLLGSSLIIKEIIRDYYCNKCKKLKCHWGALSGIQIGEPISPRLNVKTLYATSRKAVPERRFTGKQDVRLPQSLITCQHDYLNSGTAF
jgi:hypothetical protein